MQKFVIIACLALTSLAEAQVQPDWLPAHFSISSETISPDGRYGVMLPDSENDAPNQLVDMKTGSVVATLAGDPGWFGGVRSMPWGEMEAKWSEDSSTLCWIHPDKWFPQSYVVLKLQNGRVAWQVDLAKLAAREILARTEAAAPLNFAIAKLDAEGSGSAYPEGFSIGVYQPGYRVSFPLACNVWLTSDIKGSENDPEEDGVRAWLTMEVDTDGRVTYSHFTEKPGNLSKDALERVKAHTVHVHLIDTDLGKALLFPGLRSKDGRFAVGWTIRANGKAEPPVDWSHWDPANPDKTLRLYDWQRYGYNAEAAHPYEVVDFVLETTTGKTVVLPTKDSNWPGKKDGWQMIARWYSGTNGRRFALIGSGQEDLWVGNFWLVSLSENPMQVKELTVPMGKAVNDLLHERRPELGADDFMVSYPIRLGDEAIDTAGLAQVPFVANARSSDQKEYGLSGTVTIRLSNGTVTGASNDQKRLDPFVDNKALKEADEKLNALYQAALKSMPADAARVLKIQEGTWIAKRDADASQAVNMMPFGSTPQACEEAKEKSLLESTKERVAELERRAR